ncbi:MAG: hypothetical protein WAT93_00250 [Pontixanthobacter sp.]
MAKQDPVGIYAWQRHNEVVTTSGCLRESDLAALAELGVAHVIDLAPASHENSISDEGTKLARLGIKHTLIEVPFNTPTEDHYQAFVKAYEKSSLPVHVHCIYNYRVSAFLYRYNLEHGMPKPMARELMIQHWSPDASEHPAAKPWKEFIKATIRNYKARRTGT